MSTATPSTISPAIVRSQSSSSRPHSASYGNPSGDLPQRTRSTAARPPHPSHAHHRSSSRSHSYGRPPPSNQSALAGVARRDFETSSGSRPVSSHRSTSRDRNQENQPSSYRPGSTRAHHHKTSSRHGPNRNSVDMAGTRPAAPDGMSSSAQPPAGSQHPSGTAQPKRRTTINTTTGQWALGKTIGAGSMGKVKLAKNMETGEQVAIKIIPRQSTEEHRNSRDSERADRSKEIRTAREAAIVTLLDHPYICGMRDVVRTNYHWYMLFEYVNGGQMLDYIISHGRLKEKQARKFARQIASALDYCHRNSIVHRDLKIENILISKTGDIKIIDFGLSNLFSPRSHLKTFCGSLYFAAPELLQARQYTGPEVDVWSFGIVLYVLVCGKVPFDDQSMPQLHAKIKKGVVEYPQGLTTECRHIISRMLVTDPKQRASLNEILNHPWMTKGFNGTPENYLPHRDPLQLPLDNDIIEKMTGFDFGPPEYIRTQLTKVLESEDYIHALRTNVREHPTPNQMNEKKRGVFDFYKRRNSTSKDTLSNPSVEAVQLGHDPVNAYSPLISVYNLVREKRDREKHQVNPGGLGIPHTPGDTLLKMPDLPAPQAAHTNQHAYEAPGERESGGRARPRARTQGEDEIEGDIKKLHLSPPTGPTSPAIVTPPIDQPAKKESTAVGLLRRLSTRKSRGRGRDIEREKSNAQAPSVNVQPPEDLVSPPRKSFSVRRSRRGEQSPATLHPGGSQPQQDLGNAPASAGLAPRSNKYLGRSTSVNSADYRSRRLARRGGSESIASPAVNEPHVASESDHSSVGFKKFGQAEQSAAPSKPAHSQTNRTKSLGHARRESIQVRRARREEALEANVPEETDADLTGAGNALENVNNGEDFSKPVYLKGLFSVSTTSSKPLAFIRADIIRVLNQLGVEHTEIKGGFSCRHAPSIDLNKVTETRPSSQERQGMVSPNHHRRRISFGGLRSHEREEHRDDGKSKLSKRHQGPADRSFITNSEGSEEYVTHRDQAPTGERVMGETTTRVQSDTGNNLVLKFEVLIVKVPLFQLHGIQFKKVSGGMWQYREMAKKILDALRL